MTLILSNLVAVEWRYDIFCRARWDRFCSFLLFLHATAFNAYLNRVAKILENLENSGNLKSCQTFRENSGKLFIFVEKPGKLRENVKHVT